MTNVSRNRSVSFRGKDGLGQGIIREDGLSGVHGSPDADVSKEWSQAGIGNAFIFGKVMSSNPDLLLELLQISLPELHIQSIRDVRKEVDIKLSIDAHGVRLDVSARDDQGRTFDVEMQLHPASLGTLHIHVTNNAGVLTASFVTENEAVRSAVESQMVRLIEQFETQGIKVDAVEVTVASHAFEQGNDAGRSNESNEGNQKRSRRINLGDLEGDLVTDDMEEDEKIAAEMMAANGNTVDFTA